MVEAFGLSFRDSSARAWLRVTSAAGGATVALLGRSRTTVGGRIKEPVLSAPLSMLATTERRGSHVSQKTNGVLGTTAAGPVTAT